MSEIFNQAPLSNDSSLSGERFLQECATVTPARVFRGRSGRSLLTRTQLELRFDHAAAVDAVYEDQSLLKLLPAAILEPLHFFEVQTEAVDKQDYLRHPERGRRLSADSADTLQTKGSQDADVQIFVGDGLSAAAVVQQVPVLLPTLVDRFRQAGWTVGRSFGIRYCRVGVLNHVGEILRPKVAILLIGERPGLSTAESLSAYMAYRPQPGHSDADRNLLSNIHGRGIPTDQAVARIVALAQAMADQRRSGVEIKEAMASDQAQVFDNKTS